MRKRVEILEGRSDSGRPALWASVSEGFLDGYSAMSDAILGADIREVRAIKHLFLAKDDAGVPAHHRATLNGCDGVYNALVRALSRHLSPPEIRSVLMGERLDRITTWDLLKQTGNPELERQFHAAYMKLGRVATARPNRGGHGLSP